MIDAQKTSTAALSIGYTESRRLASKLYLANRRRKLCYSSVGMDSPQEKAPVTKKPAELYCPVCAVEIDDPLTCGDCSAVICRRCGTPLESPDELAMG